MAKLILAEEFPEVLETDWIKQAEGTLKSGGVDRLVSKTLDDIAVQPIYSTPSEAFSNLSVETKSGDAPWQIVQRADIPDLARANEQILDDLLNGATGISLVLPGAVTASSYGVPANTVPSIKRLMTNVELDLISLRLDAGPGARQAAINLLQVYQDRNLDMSRCDLSFCLDPVAGFARRGSTANTDKISKRMAGFLSQTRDAGHQGNVFTGDGRIYHETGASQAQELGFAIAAIVEQARLLEQAGVDLATIWPQLGLILSANANQFLTIAKLRAARLVWQRLQEAMGFEPVPLHLDVETSLAMMSKCDPYVNMLRTTTATFAAGVGGANSISVLPFTSALGVADGFARRIARNSHIVLQEESSVGIVGDAAAGSGYVETVTTQIAEKAWGIMQQVEAAGGMFQALTDGVVQNLISESAAKTAAAVSKRKQGLIGVSEFANLAEMPVKTLDFEPLLAAAVKSEDDLVCQVLSPVSVSAPFEALRDKASAMAKPPEVKLATLGTQTDFATRTTWIENLFAAGGIIASSNATNCKIGCICSSDAIYAEQAAAAVKQLKSDGVEFIFLAGYPKDQIDDLKRNGVDDFIYAGCDVLALLQNTLKKLEG